MIRKQTQKDGCVRTSGWAGRSSVLWVVLLCASLGMAQLDTGTISGTVTDQSGGAAPGATIAVRNVATGVTRTLQSNAAGRYEAPHSRSGIMKWKRPWPGFRRSSAAASR